MARQDWTSEQVKLAFHLYCQLPFGRLHQNNPEIIALSTYLLEITSWSKVRLRHSPITAECVT